MFLSTKAIRNVYINNIISIAVVLVFFAFSANFKISEISKEINCSLDKSNTLLSFFTKSTIEDLRHYQISQDHDLSFLFRKIPYLRAAYKLDNNGKILDLSLSKPDIDYIKEFSGSILLNPTEESFIHISKTKTYPNKDESIFIILKNEDKFFVAELNLDDLYDYFVENKIIDKNTILLDKNSNAVFKKDIYTLGSKSIYNYFGSFTKINSLGINLNAQNNLIIYKIVKNKDLDTFFLYQLNFVDTFLPSFFIVIFMVAFFIILLTIMKLHINSLNFILLTPIQNFKNIIKDIKRFKIKQEKLAEYKCKNEDFNEALKDISYLYKKYQDIRNFLKQAYYKDNYIFNKSSLVILMVNAYDGTILSASNEALKFYKYTKQSLLTKTIFDIDKSKQNAYNLERIKYPYKKRSIFKTKHMLADRSVKDVMVEMSYTKIQNKLYQIIIARDISNEINLMQGIKQEHKILDMSPFVVFNFSDRILKKVDFVSYTVNRILGYEQEEIMNENFDIYTILHPDDVSKLISIFKTNMRLTNINGINTQFEQSCRILNKNGSYSWFNLFFKIIKNNKSIQTIIYVINYSDILKQKNSLEAQIKRYKNLLLACNIITYEINLETDMISFSENISDILGLDTKDKVASMHILSFKQLIHQKDYKKLDYSIGEHANYKKDIFKEEIRLIGKDGREIWVLFIGKIISRDKQKNPALIYGGLIDIDYKKKFEQLTVLHYETFLNSSQGIIITDKKGTILETNKTFDKIFRYKNPVGQSIKILKSNKNDMSKYKRLLQYIKNSDYHRDILWLKAADKNSILTMLSITKIKDDFNHTKNYVINFHTMSKNYIRDYNINNE